MELQDLKQNKALAAKFLKLLGEGNTEECLSLVSDDIEYWVVGSTVFSGYHDKGFLRQMLGGLTQMFDGPMIIEPIGYTAEGSRVAIEAKGIARMASGKEYFNMYNFIFVIEDGKITNLREYMDTAYANEAFGS